MGATLAAIVSVEGEWGTRDGGNGNNAEEEELYGDRAYWCESDRQLFEAEGIRYRVNRRGTAKKPLSEYWKRINRSRSRVRARCEHSLLVVKRLWGFNSTR